MVGIIGFCGSGDPCSTVPSTFGAGLFKKSRFNPDPDRKSDPDFISPENAEPAESAISEKLILERSNSFPVAFIPLRAIEKTDDGAKVAAAFIALSA